jgi:uncharacterized alkaline shock family protein YloU
MADDKRDQNIDEPSPDDEFEVGTAAPLVAAEVVAAYVADAVRQVPGVAALHASPWRAFGHRSSVVSTEGVVVRMISPRSVDLSIHIRIKWDAVIPDVAREVEELVRRRLLALLDMEVDRLVINVDEVEAPCPSAQ